MPLVRKGPAGAPPPPADSPALLAALSGGTDDERWAAARALAELPGGAQALCAALARERIARVREAIFTGLARISTAESVECVLPLLRSDDASLRGGALDALRAMRDVVWPYIPRLLRDRDADVRVLACELARNMPEERASELLCALLDSEPDANVCASALEVLAEVGGPAVLPVLAKCEARFRGTAFVEFSIKATAERIRSQSRA